LGWLPAVAERLAVGALAPWPGGCRCAEGGTPDPCHRDHPARPGVKLERPQAASSPPGPSQLAGDRRPSPHALHPGRLRAGWYSRRVRASAERGRVQGPGRAEADLGPRTVPVVLLPRQFLAAILTAAQRFLRPLGSPRMGPLMTPLIPPLMGPPTPPLMGPPGGGGPGGAGLGPFPLVRRFAGQGHAQKPRMTPPRFAT
jgi:hypothetical protein